MTLVLRELDEEQRALLVFTSFDALVAGCGTNQPYVSFRSEGLQEFQRAAEAEARLASDNPGHDPQTRGKNRLLSLVTTAQATITERRANTNHIGRWLEKLPKDAKDIVTARVTNFLPRRTRYLAKAPGVLKSISAVGGSLSAVAAGLEIAGGKDPAIAVTSNSAGLLAGTVTGMALTGPFGAIAAFVVATGTTSVIDSGLTTDEPQVIAPELPPNRHLPGPPR